MCGIGGYIGHSTEPGLSYELMTRLFSHLELRGVDAAGVWAAESGRNGSVLYHKEPIRSSEFVESPFWSKIKDYNTNLLLAHARGATRGMGSPLYNKNNHPFASQDRRLALVHNGVIHESSSLRQRYQTSSDCDSEVLLRIYEALAPEKVMWLQAVKEIWSLVREGHMAVAIGERHEDNTRTLCLFRNDKRPLWMADLRDDLGQVFFFSSVEIWERAVARCRSHTLRRGHMLMELPVSQAWHFTLGGELTYTQYQIDVKPKSWDWNPGRLVPIAGPKVKLNVITQLDERDNVIIAEPVIRLPLVEDKPPDEFEESSEAVQEMMREVMTEVYNLWTEGSLSESEMDRILSQVEGIKGFLDNIAQIAKR